MSYFYQPKLKKSPGKRGKLMKFSFDEGKSNIKDSSPTSEINSILSTQITKELKPLNLDYKNGILNISYLQVQKLLKKLGYSVETAMAIDAHRFIK